MRIYFLPIGGTAMASLAGLLQAVGHEVTGVDSALYPPMSTVLENAGIPVRLGFDPAAIPGDIDRVIIGNAVGIDNPEVQEVMRRRIPFLSQAEAVAHELLARGRRAVVVAGTHGKTTTSALLSWILEDAGADPTYLVGGVLSWSGRSFRLGNGPLMVIEGDEYNAAFFDRGPKFLHYRPEIFLLGPVEYDHADIYPSLDAVLTSFRAGTAQVPPRGFVIVNAWSPRALDAIRDATAHIITVGSAPEHTFHVSGIASGPAGGSACVAWQGQRYTLQLPLWGAHNVQDAAMAFAGAVTAGVAPGAALGALARFPGVKRRMEVVGSRHGVTVVDDFAHHPTALAATIAAARERWPGSRLIVVYEPRSLTAGRHIFQEAYPGALAGADVVVLAPVYHADRLDEDDRLDRGAIATALAGRGIEAYAPAEGTDLVDLVLPMLDEGDVVLACSSGDLGGFHHRLLAHLAGPAAPAEVP
ncbi:MAG: UDP-N-acetylmuramate:L-alanyl-gamma-D-glutamyl-meso-diaminopimelate ligase [Acidobacteria bacterium]|nr:UDP-N-acetylmuramate:L-alanyl-gamma-D-glutamyl-meso-diaminopimelate ligase [Acidobacteriota bacterium]